jgi:hypothetical protein
MYRKWQEGPTPEKERGHHDSRMRPFPVTISGPSRLVIRKFHLNDEHDTLMCHETMVFPKKGAPFFVSGDGSGGIFLARGAGDSILLLGEEKEW